MTTLREWITDPDGDPREPIMVNGSVHTREQLLDELPLADAIDQPIRTTITDPTPQQVLDTPMQPNDCGAPTVRSYLVELLSKVWAEEEGFDPKRPFGDSGWQHDLCGPLAEAGYVRPVEHGYHSPEDESCKRTHRLISRAIRSMNQEN